MGHIAGKGLFPGGSCRNRDCYKPSVNFAPEIPEETQMLLFTPERYRFWIVGEVVDGKGIEVLK